MDKIYRVEEDSIGSKNIPKNAYYGIQSERARENFDVSGLELGRYKDFIFAIAVIKKAAAIANYKVGAIDKSISDAIVLAAEEVMNGKYDDQFLMDIFQGGGGTSANMNVNEVIANRSNEILSSEKGYNIVHPNTHVNMGQSTNDVIPSSMKIACYRYLDRVIKSAEYLAIALRKKEKEFADIVKMGRTCLQDALPVTLGQEFGGYASMVERRVLNLKDLRDKCFFLSLGATAVGTKVTVRVGYIENVYKELKNILGVPVVIDDNLFDALQNADIYSDISAGLKGLAMGLSKMATDFRIMSSGPNTGLKEIILPAVQPGSSIMPGKINPVMPELINQICYQIVGNDVAISMGVEGGELDLNVWEPLIIKCITESSTLLEKSIPLFVDNCIMGIKANRELCREGSEKSIALSTVVAMLIDYEAGSKVAKEAYKKGVTIKEVVIAQGILSREDADILLDPMILTDGETFAQKVDEYKKRKG